MEKHRPEKTTKSNQAIKAMKQANRANRKIRQQANFNLNITPHDYRGMHFLGNFPNKHCYRNEELRDHRLSRLPSSLFTNKKVIDVGSGQSSLAIQIALRFFPAQIIALDIDGKLLGRAKNKVDKIVKNNAIYSNREQTLLKKIQDLPLYFQDLFNKNRQKYQLKPNHSIEVIPQGETFINKFPDNFSLYNQNFMNIQKKQEYDTILIMGTSKWIHLALGDQGLIKMFEKAYDLLAYQGFLVVQYPLYRSYHKKKNICKLYSKNLKEHINIDPITIPSILCHMGFVLVQELASIPQVTLKHPIAIFSKKQPKEIVQDNTTK